MQLPPIDNARYPLLSVGLRPFYLMAALFAALSLPLWLAQLNGLVHLQGYLQFLAWHSHEMLFGFAAAVIAGFLLTAVRQWSSLPTPQGTALAAMVLLWVTGRVMMLTGPAVPGALVDAAFLPLLAATICIPLWRSRQLHSLALVSLVLGVLVLANGTFHLAHLGLWAVELESISLIVAIDMIALLMTVMGGRIIPAFTNNAVPEAGAQRSVAVERAAVGSVILVVVADLLSLWAILPAMLWVILLAGAALVHGWRIALWNPWATRRNALLWILPVSYAWIPVALAIRACAQIMDGIPPALWVHALGVGAMGGLMLAMMTRSALGHSGRPLVAGTADVLAYVLLHAAAVIRVFVPLGWPQLYPAALTTSALCWTAAFAIFVMRYFAILTQPRIDGAQSA